MKTYILRARHAGGTDMQFSVHVWKDEAEVLATILEGMFGLTFTLLEDAGTYWVFKSGTGMRYGVFPA